MSEPSLPWDMSLVHKTYKMKAYLGGCDCQFTLLCISPQGIFIYFI